MIKVFITTVFAIKNPTIKVFIIKVCTIKIFIVKVFTIKNFTNKVFIIEAFTTKVITIEVFPLEVFPIKAFTIKVFIMEAFTIKAFTVEASTWLSQFSSIISTSSWAPWNHNNSQITSTMSTSSWNHNNLMSDLPSTVSLLIWSIGSLVAFILALFCYFEFQNQHTRPRGCRKLGLGTFSNLKDEHDPRYAKGSSTPQYIDGKSNWRVKSLLIYPVKSCKAVELSHGTIIPTGVQYDRQFSFAQLLSTFPVSSNPSQAENQDHTWTFITQRQRPQLARVRPEIWVPDPSSPTYSEREPNVQSQGVVVINFPRFDGLGGWVTHRLYQLGIRGFERSFQIPFNPTEEQIEENHFATEAMKIWKESPESLRIASTYPSENNEILKELSRFLEISNTLALFRAARVPNREVYRCAPRKEQLGYQSVVGFQDSFPLHMMNLASVRDVGKKLAKGSPLLSALQFRPNILITGPAAYLEDNWKKVKIGDFEYFVCCRTARCQLPNVNQVTGIKDKVEPNQTLRATRAIDPGAAPHACLGMQLVPAREEGTIRVGDEIEVLEVGDHFYLK